MCLSNAPPALKSGSLASDILYVPTFAAEKPPKKMDMKDLDSSEKLANLKNEDPFFYYSLPPVHDAVMHGKRADPSSVQNQVISEAASRTEADNGGRTIVRRRSCLSFESHYSCLLKEYLQNQVISEAASRTEADNGGRTIVRRRSCLSFESHDSCLLKELIAASSTNTSSSLLGDHDDFFDMFISYVPDVPEPSTKRSKHE